MGRSNENHAARRGAKSLKHTPKPRVCMPTCRNFSREAFQCSLYEAQDVLLEIDDVDLIRLEPSWGFRFRDKWQRRLLFRDVSRSLLFRNPGLQKVRLTQEYDLFVAVCQNYWDLLYINAIDGWKDHCKTSVCWIDEVWASDISICKHWFEAFRRFDYVFVGYSGTAAPLSQAINRTCRWLPCAVDTIRFSPYPIPPARVIDVYSMGRRWPGIHDALLQASADREIFYSYDTFPGMANMAPYDHKQHRDLFANVAKRSRYFMVSPGKMDRPKETEGQIEIGYRYYEGAASGAVMIGQPPECKAFREVFPWPDVVIPIQPDGSDVMQVLARLDSEPERVAAISRRNASEALLRHDWVYRWKEIFRVAGIETSPAMAERERRLKELADLTPEHHADWTFGVPTARVAEGH